MVYQADQIGVAGHGRELTADGLRRKEESNISHSGSTSRSVTAATESRRQPKGLRGTKPAVSFPLAIPILPSGSEPTSRNHGWYSRSAARRDLRLAARAVLASKVGFAAPQTGAPLPAPRRSGLRQDATAGPGGNTIKPEFRFMEPSTLSTGYNTERLHKALTLPPKTTPQRPKAWSLAMAALAPELQPRPPLRTQRPRSPQACQRGASPRTILVSLGGLLTAVCGTNSASAIFGYPRLGRDPSQIDFSLRQGGNAPRAWLLSYVTQRSPFRLPS